MLEEVIVVLDRVILHHLPDHSSDVLVDSLRSPVPGRRKVNLGRLLNPLVERIDLVGIRCNADLTTGRSLGGVLEGLGRLRDHDHLLEHT